MCGICGFNWEDKGLLKDMLSVMNYRGPDMEGTFFDKDFSLGHKRLSIIDLSEKGRQPMPNEEGDIFIVFNGEIYNYKEIRKNLKQKHNFTSNTDTEVILHLYEEVGEKFVNYLNGDFSIFIYNIKNNKGILVRDRFGIKPLYYYWDDKNFIFSSEIKGILKWDGFSPRVRRQSLSDYMVYSFVPSPYTMLENVYKVSPSEIVVIDFKKLRIERKNYYNLSFKIAGNNFSFAKKKFEEELYNSVKRRLIADVPVGAYLSGGLDSSSVVAVMSKMKGNLKTFSVGFDSNDVQDELKYARIVSEYCNTDHRELHIGIDAIKKFPVVLWHLDEPINNIASIPLYFLSEEARKNVTVVLNGNGADEALAGYRHYKILNYIYKSLIPKFPFSISKNFISKNSKYYNYLSQMENMIANKNDKESLHKAVLYKNFTDEERKELFGYFNYRQHFSDAFRTNSSYLAQLQAIDLKNLLSSNLLIVDDKMAMAHSIESRVPFLDHLLVNFACSVPDSYKLHSGTGKYILRQIMKKSLPKTIVNRNKYGFTPPLKTWFAFFKDDAYEKLTNSDYFNRELIKQKFNNLTNPNINQLWQLYVFEKWNEIFVLNRGKKPK